MEEKNEFELVVAEGERALWKTLLAAVLFTYMVYNIYLMAQLFFDFGFCNEFINRIPNFIKGICYGLSGGIAFSITKTILLDVDNNKLISRYCVGPFSKDVLTIAPKLEYVAVYLDPKDYYQVNLWYKGNKHYKMYRFDKKLIAMKFGIQVANKLNINLLDKTDLKNPIWINKSEL
ncbi:MAG: hypothetical protein V4548_14225 [Bacteroidota bacterium]